MPPEPSCLLWVNFDDELGRSRMTMAGKYIYIYKYIRTYHIAVNVYIHNMLRSYI